MANASSNKGRLCPSGRHQMDPNWEVCPYCEGERRAGYEEPFPFSDERKAQQDIKPISFELMARIILLAIRDGKITDGFTLTRVFPFSRTEDYRIYRVLGDLADAGLIDVDNVELPRKISLSRSWPRIQTTLGLSLQELVENEPEKTMSVKPFFGKPKRFTTSIFDVFMAMPFTEELKPIYEDHIKTVVEQAKLKVRRGDDFFTANSVMEDVWSAICNARIVIAECTDRNPNVFYEIGMAHTIGKPIILITQNSDDVPFDLRHIRYIKYDYSPRGMKNFEVTLKRTLEETLNSNNPILG
jgi:hypothetical protein